MSALACTLATLAGCATAPPASDAPQAARDGNRPGHIALIPLAHAAQRELARPVREAAALPPPPGIDPDLLEPPPDETLALLPLQEAAQRLAAQDLGLEPPPEAPPAGEREREAALRRYIMGRQKLLEGDSQSAIEDLRHATRLDPHAPEPWLQLGDAHIMRSARTDAVAAYRAAIARGLADPRLFELLGRDALDRDAYTEAARYFARARQAVDEAEDPILPMVIEVGLAGAMANLGYLAAASDSLRQALERQTPATSSTRYMQEFGAIFRRQGDLWRQVGDAELRLGRFAPALDAYRRAAALPAIDQRADIARVVYAAMRAGRPAAAGMAVIEEIIETGGLVGEHHLALLRHIAGTASYDGHSWNSPVRLETAAALSAYRSSLGDSLAPAVARSMVRAEAAVLGSVARSRLREFIIATVPDVDVAGDIISLCASADDAVREAVAIVIASPHAAPEFAEAFLRSRFEIPQIETRLLRPRRPAAQTVLAAQFFAARGLFAAGLDTLDGLESRDVPPAFAPALALARVELALASGGPSPPPDSIPAPTTPADARAVARALSLLQRHAEALAILGPHLAPDTGIAPAQRLETLLLGAQLAAEAGRLEDAERWLRAAQHSDPHDERAYTQLLTIYSPGGKSPDAGRSTIVLRDLRTNIPGSRTERLIITRELMRRSLLPQAESGALQLADESPDLAALELLVGIWQLQAQREGEGALARALEWIRIQRERRPSSVPLLAAATTLLVEADRMQDAADLLRSAIEQGAGRDASRMLERVLRDGLHRPGEADELARARLNHHPLSPADSLDLAEMCIRDGRAGDSASALRAVLSPEITLVGDQVQRIAAALFQLAAALNLPTPPADGTPPSWEPPEAVRRVLDLIESALARGLILPGELHDRRLRLLAADPTTTFERLNQAAMQASAQHPPLRWQPWALAAHTAGAMGRGELALRLIRQAVEQTPRPEVELLMEWFASVFISGDIDDAREMIDHLHEGGRLIDVLARVNIQLPPGGDARAELAFILGNQYSSLGRDDRAAAAYELAIEYAPGHPWACKNLGYMILENGGDLARADELLTLAFNALPGETSVIDSLGWLRYMQAVFEDERDQETGRIIRRGAVSLLARAARSAEGRRNPTILDHYGDALYRAGRIEQARGAWRAAHGRATEQVAETHLAIRTQPEPSPALERLLESYQRIADSARDKLGASADDTPAPVAPLPGESAGGGAAPPPVAGERQGARQPLPPGEPPPMDTPQDQ